MDYYAVIYSRIVMAKQFLRTIIFDYQETNELISIRSKSNSCNNWVGVL